jgi:hypothetical protein
MLFKGAHRLWTVEDLQTTKKMKCLPPPPWCLQTRGSPLVLRLEMLRPPIISVVVVVVAAFAVVARAFVVVATVVEGEACVLLMLLLRWPPTCNLSCNTLVFVLAVLYSPHAELLMTLKMQLTIVMTPPATSLLKKTGSTTMMNPMTLNWKPPPPHLTTRHGRYLRQAGWLLITHPFQSAPFLHPKVGV